MPLRCSLYYLLLELSPLGLGLYGNYGQRGQNSWQTFFKNREIHAEFAAPIHAHIVFVNMALTSDMHSVSIITCSKINRQAK